MCSTPFGVIVGFTRKRPPNWSRRRVLNAFRRHRRVHATAGRSRCAGPHGAQRLSASSSGSRHRADRLAPVRRRVLNAFRRHRRVHRRERVVPRSRVRCSTPFGVIVGFTDVTPRFVRLMTGAQRLSASSSGSLAILRPTPDDLNEGAQRLSASSSGSPSPESDRKNDRRRCAQRLSASSSGSHGTSDRPAADLDVLNAFRRHRRVHSSSCSAFVQVPLACSTPFGVIVGFTLACVDGTTGVSQLLNAFRRHRRVHAGPVGDDRRGRRVLNAFRRHRRVHVPRSCGSTRAP